MFGFVTAAMEELSSEQKNRYNRVYCGICRQIRLRSSAFARLGLSYDMAFLALLHMSLYEPEETFGDRACGLHPIHPRPWLDSPFIRYCADMNVALAHYNFLDDYTDEKNPGAKFLADRFGKGLPRIEREFPRQCRAIRNALETLSRLEAENCANPDEPANAFGQLMGELFVYEEDQWASTLRSCGQALGRFIYLADAAEDYSKDEKKYRYNPFLAMGTGEDWTRWEQYLTLSMGRCTKYYEILPLVQDKPLLDNILYGGVWTRFRDAQKRRTKGKEGSK